MKNVKSNLPSKLFKNLPSYKKLSSKHSNSRPEFLLNKNLLNSKRSQIWVETVIYTLIGLTVIAMILVTTVPRIEKMKERSIIEQTISSMNGLNEKVLETESILGNVRIVDFRITKGKLQIDAPNDQIVYILEDAKLEMSEPGVEIQQGDVILITEKTGSKYNITLTLDYNNIDLTYDGKEQTRVLHAGTVFYKINIENEGVVGDKTKINIDVI